MVLNTKATAFLAYKYSLLVSHDHTVGGSYHLQYASKYYFSMGTYTTSNDAS